MTAGTRLFIIASLVVLPIVPLLTLHAVYGHLSGSEIAHLQEASIDIGLVAIALLSLAAALPAALAITAVIRATRALKSLQRLGSAAVDAKFRDVPYRRIAANQVAVFTGGLRKPRIYVTTAAEEALTEQSLAAALAHEQGHIAAGDTRWRTALRTLDTAFGRLPGVRSTVDAALLEAELSADDHALGAGASRLALFDAVATAASGPAGTAGVGGSAAQLRLARLATGQQVETGRPDAAFAAIAAWAVALPVAAHVIVLIGVLCNPRLGA